MIRHVSAAEPVEVNTAVKHTIGPNTELVELQVTVKLCFYTQ